MNTPIALPGEPRAPLHDATPDGDTHAGPRRAGPVARGMSLITPIGVVAGDVLLHLERRGAMTLRRLARELKWPVRLVVMGVGALIREGLVRGVQQDMDVLIEPQGQVEQAVRAA